MIGNPLLLPSLCILSIPKDEFFLKLKELLASFIIQKWQTAHYEQTLDDLFEEYANA